MSSKKPKRFKKVVEYDCSWCSLNFETDSFWLALFLPIRLLCAIPVAIIFVLGIPFDYFSERKVYYGEVKR